MFRRRPRGHARRVGVEVAVRRPETTLKITLRESGRQQDHVEGCVCSRLTDSLNVIFNVIMDVITGKAQYGDARSGNIGKCSTFLVHNSASRCCAVAAMT